jgi:hypothetical protein
MAVETTTGLPSTGGAVDGPRATGRSRRLLERCLAHPVLVTLFVALLVRVTAAVLINRLHAGVLIPDEHQYVDLAASVARGDGADAWFPGYGQLLYQTTFPFTGTVAFLFQHIGPYRILAQLVAAVAGAGTAAAVAQLALEAVPRRYALAAGLLAAVFPSQVLWSSVALRESVVWLGLAVMAVALAAAARRPDARGVLISLAALFLALVMLARLREQTFVVAAWAAALALIFCRPKRAAWMQRGAVLAMVVLIPVWAGYGYAGFSLVQRAVPGLGTTRANLADGAQSAIVKPPPPTATTAPATPTPPPAAPRGAAQTLLDDSVAPSIRHLPAGLFAVTLRPVPGEPIRNADTAFSELENLGWYLLYVLAACGIVMGRRHRRLAFAAIVTVGVLLSGALYEGNVGTAFRHRGQVLWALLVLAAVGLHEIVQRRSIKAQDGR